MKTITHRNRILCVCAGTALLTTATLLAEFGEGFHSFGTDILHLSIDKWMTNNGVETNASGFVHVDENKQGHADFQNLNVHVAGLTTNTPYQLLARVDDNSNWTFVAQFNTDADGDATLRFSSRTNGPGHNHGMGSGDENEDQNENQQCFGSSHHHRNGPAPLPAALIPVSDIHEVDVVNGSTQAVLTADLTMPDNLQYLIKRNLSTNGIGAELRIKANLMNAKIRLTASGLNPTNDYWLVLNGGIAQTNTADTQGRLMVTFLLMNPTDILGVHTLALWDTSSNAVLSTELP